MNAAQLNPQQSKLYSWLIEVAAIGEPCPANAAIRRRCGISGGDANATHALQALEKQGLITIESGHGGERRMRVVTIVATGNSTARPKDFVILSPRPIPSVRTPEALAAARARPANAADRLDEIRRAAERVKARVSAAEALPQPLPAASPAAPVELEPQASIPSAPDPAPIAPEPPATTTPEEKLMPVDTPPTTAAPAPLNPFSASVEVEDGRAMLTVHMSLDPGPARQFREFLRVPLDEMHLLELLGTSALSLRQIQEQRA